MKFKQSQKFRVIAGAGTVNFHITAKMIRQGVGSSQSFNLAVKEAMEFLEDGTMVDPRLGVVGSFNGRQIQLDLIDL